jgi:hypothetical protein
MSFVEQFDSTPAHGFAESSAREREVSELLELGEADLRERIEQSIVEHAQQHFLLESLYENGVPEDGVTFHFLADNLGSLDRGTSHDSLEGVFSVKVDETESEDPEQDGLWLNVRGWVRGDKVRSLWFKCDDPTITDHESIATLELARIGALMHPLRCRRPIDFSDSNYLIEHGIRGILPDKPLGKCLSPARKPTALTKRLQKAQELAPEQWTRKVRKINREGRAWVSHSLSELLHGPDFAD